MQTPVYLVWLKRNLRLEDNPCLVAALHTARAARRPVQLLYLHEPSLEADAHCSPRHARFVAQSLAAMDRALTREGLDHRILRLYGEAVPMLEALIQRRPIAGLFSEEEIGIRQTWDRDKAVAHWCRQRGVHWTETPHSGVQRGRQNREAWRAHWYGRMRQPVPRWHGLKADPTPHAAALPLLAGAARDAWSRGLPQMDENAGLGAAEPKGRQEGFQQGGSATAHRVLQRFLAARLPDYMRHISKPAESRDSCSRLSP